MQEELFDVVDEHDRVLRQVPRSVVHAEKLLHRAVHVFVFDNDGKMYVQLRSPIKDEYPNCFTSSCSGHVDAGEDYDAAAVRELKEELGLTVDSLSRLQKFPASKETSYEHTVLYRLQTSAPIQPDPEEITAVDIMPVDLIEQFIAARPDRYCPAFKVLFRWYCHSDHVIG
ncbi:MAG: NUDIX domain-containing protein [Planctomycetota bacterium]|nr:NUDIX domain-containing protein [Planctomycetota bacterium]MDA1212453.1 NUDIX domain-containing protein [Planctomycetota bacterium]